MKIEDLEIKAGKKKGIGQHDGKPSKMDE